MMSDLTRHDIENIYQNWSNQCFGTWGEFCETFQVLKRRYGLQYASITLLKLGMEEELTAGSLQARRS
ncbi:MAG: hypothetical protein HY683_02245 [Chloroflexi bacterium]|nr:hypothetical protein [Chloroflexota bacterium]